MFVGMCFMCVVMEEFWFMLVEVGEGYMGCLVMFGNKEVWVFGVSRL